MLTGVSVFTGVMTAFAWHFADTGVYWAAGVFSFLALVGFVGILRAACEDS